MSIYFEDTEYGKKENIEKLWKVCNLKPGDVFIDCGANLGQEIECFRNSGIIFDSYEPHPFFFQKLKESFGNEENVTLNNKAVWIKNGSQEFFFKKNRNSWTPEHSSGGSSLIKKTNHSSDKAIVETVDICDVINKHEKVKILKVDIEGAEYKVLRRLIEKNLITKPEFIFFEEHLRKIHPIDLDEFLADKNYFEKFAEESDIKFYRW